MAKRSKFKPKTGGKAHNRAAEKINPFEIHVNRSKHDVLGRKRKEDRGLPGIARAKALKKREKTLLQEYKTRHKSNLFVDRRIGENDPTLDPEKKIALRLAAVKTKHANRKSMFNLNDDDFLTHGGKTLDDDNIDDRMAFSDDEDDQVLDAQFVKERHFAGGFLTKRETGDEEKPKSKKEWIDEIIAESKKKKAEAKKDKEEQYEAVSKLDANLNTFLMMMSGKTIKDEDKLEAKKNCEFRDYDTLVKELGFDRTGKAKTSSKLKTPEELIKEEKEKLLALEADRVRRMKGEPEPSKHTSRSADDLDDGLIFTEDDRFHLSYKDGAMLEEEKGNDDNDPENDNKSMDEEGAEDEETENEDEGVDSDLEDGDDLEDDESDKYSDIFDEESGDEDNDNENDTQETEKTKDHSVAGDKRKEIMEAARKEIPYTFEVPQEYDAFWALLENRSPKEVSVILERTIACNHPSLGAQNKDKFEDLCTYILQTLNVLTEESGDSPVRGVPPMSYVDVLIPHLYTVTQACSSGVANSFRQVLEEKYEDCSKVEFKRYPMADCFVFLKVAGVLFPSSDYIHPVMTPVITFLSQLLGQAKVNTKRDITAALFTSYLLYEYLSMSKRFVPELPNALNGLLSLSIEAKKKVKLPINPPFKRFGAASSLLLLENNIEEETLPKLSLASLNDKGKEITDNFKVNILSKTVKLLHCLCDCWSKLPSVKALMEPTAKILEAICLDHYPSSLKEMITGLKSAIDCLPGPKQALVKEAKKPKSLKMYEPAIERVIEGMKKSVGTKDFQEKQKLLQKLKRERKGAKREIQRDTAFLARQQLMETLQSDAERKRKVNQIMAGLQSQESDHKKLKLKKF